MKDQDPHQPSSLKGYQLVSIVFTSDTFTARGQELERGKARREESGEVGEQGRERGEQGKETRAVDVYTQ